MYRTRNLCNSLWQDELEFAKSNFAVGSRKRTMDFNRAVRSSLNILYIACGLLLGSWQLTTVQAASNQYTVEQIGNSLTPSTEGVDAPGTVVLLNSPFPKDGVVYAFQAYFRFLETTAFQIWRPTASNSSASGAFTLVAEITAKPSTNTEPIYIGSRFTRCVRVRAGDMFGVLSFEGPSPIGYVFDPFATPRALVYSSSNATWSPDVGQTIVFRNITFPYDLSCQAFYYLETLDINSLNDTTVDCPRDLSVNDVGNGFTTTLIPISSGQPGVNGPQGPKGGTGSTGSNGVVGPQGVPGQYGPVGSVGFTGAVGLPGAAGATGPIGGIGDTGYTGPPISGSTGAPGPVGLEGPPGLLVSVNISQPLRYEASQGSDSDSSNRWTSELFMIGMLIWLSIISVIVLVLLLCLIIISCVICAVRRQDKRTKAKVKEFHHRESDPYGSLRNTTMFDMDTNPSEALAAQETIDGTLSTLDFPRSPDTPTWKEAMKEDSVQEYKVWHMVQ